MEKQSNTISYVAFAGVDWWYHNRAHSELQLLTRLARDHKVLIVNSIGMRVPLPGKTSRPFYKIWRKLKSIARLMKRPDPDLPNLYVYSPLPWPFYGSEAGRRFGASFVSAQVSVAARIADIHNPAIFTTTPAAFPVIAKMKRRCLIYNRADKHSLYKEANKTTMEALERELLASADVTLYANKTLLAEEQALTQGKAMYLDHGVDPKHFDYLAQHGIPDDLARIPKPIIGFFGNLRSYMVDFSLLARIARDIPEASVVLIGDSQDSTAELEGIKNIHLLGKKSYDEIPSYGAFFDVALIPYHDNEWIRYCNPIKLKEYLALGLMIVSTDYPEAHSYGDRIQIAADADEMVKDIRNCLAHPITPQGRQRLRESVVDQTWDERTQRLADYVDDRVHDRTRPTTDVAPPAQIDRDSVRS
jgi:glycosyltransferase involved in cell wall biosynthesis